MGRLLARAAAVVVIAVLLHACSAQGDSAQISTNGSSSSGGSSGGSSSGIGGGNSNSSAAPVVDVKVTPTQLDAGGSLTVSWTTQNALTCAADGNWSGTLPLNNTSGMLIGPLSAGTYTYGVSCTGKGGTTAADQTVQVGAVAAPVITFAVTPGTIQPGSSAALTWTTTNATSCVGSGGTGSDGWATTQPTSSTGFSTGAISTAATYEYDLTCTGPGGSTEVTKALDVDTSATVPAPTITGFTATPTQIQPNQTTTLSWSSNATSCAASGGSGSDGWSGSEPTSSTGVVVGPIAAAGRYAYTLTCSGPGGNTASTVDVLVSTSTTPPPVTVTIGVLPLQIVAGNSAALTWSTTNANSCVASGSWNGTKQLLGTAVPTRVLTAAGVYTFTLTCAGNDGTSGSGSASLTVTPGPATIGSFTASPTSILTGQSTTLTWTTNNATSCTASGGTGSDNWSGSVGTSSGGTSVGPISTAGTYTYSLVCSGPGGASAPQSLNVTVTSASAPAASVSTFVATPSSVQTGNTASLSWSSANATSCSASGGIGSDGWSGSVGTASTGTTVGPFPTAGTYTYTLTCTGPGGTGTPTSVAINVTATATPAGSVRNFSATPSTIQTGQAATLSWSSDAATACTASGGAPGSTWTGSVPVVSTGTSTGVINTAGSYTYTLLCTGPGGTGAPSSTTLNVINPPGSAASIGAFSAASTNLTTGQGTTLSWSTTNATSCTASGGSGSDGWSGTVGTSSTGTAVGPFSTAGIYTYTLNCTGAGGASGPSSVSIDVTNPPAQATVTSFAATPASFQVGGAAELTWTSSGATSCTATGGTGSDGWTGSVGTLSTGTSTGAITTAGSYTYTLTCAGPGGTGPSSSVIVNVTSAPPPAATISAFTASPNSIVAGQSTTLSWSSANATSCTASGGTGSDGWTGSVGTSSSGFNTGAISTPGNYVYTLTCTGPGGSGSQSVGVDVTAAPPAPSIYTFNVTPSTAQTGQSVVASWSTANATSCTASGGTGSDGWSGTVPTSSTGTTIGPVTPAGNYTYTLTCSGAGGTSAPSSAGLTVTNAPVPPTIGSFSASPIAIQTGGSTTLSWTSTNATSCTAGGGTGSWGGSVPTSSTGTTIGPITTAGTYIFTLTCTGAGGTSATSAATVTVTAAAPAASIVSFIATPTTITAGGSVLLSWVSSGASACTASGGTGSDGWNGTVSTNSVGTTVGPLNTAGVYVYTLNCTGPGGASSPASVDVTVNAATPAATVASFGAAPTTVTVGQTTQLAWTTTNATSCSAGGGTGSDGWSGTQAPSSTGTTVGPFTATGTVTYTLTCTGAGGASSPATTTVTVNAATPQQPIVSLLANGHATLTATIGNTVTMTWTSSNATACTASGGAGTDNWSGTEPTSSTGFTLGNVSTPGTYSYTLTCTGAGGSGSATVKITYLTANATDCGLPGIATTSLVSPAATVTDTVQGLCVGCSVLNQGNVINASTTSPAVISEVAGLLGGDVVLEVGQTSATFPAGRTVGFILTSGSSLLSLSALQNVTLTTYLGTTPEQVATVSNNLLTLQALGVLSVNSDAGFAGFVATKPFNQVSVQVNQLAGVLTTVNVYRACVSLQ
jgi:hypothetical protein